MLSGLATYFFGSSEYDENGELLAETCIQGMDGEDWILVDQKISISSGPSCSSSPIEGKLVQSDSNFSHDDRKGSCTLDSSSSTTTCSTKNLVASNSILKTSSSSKESKQPQQQQQLLSGSCSFDSSPSSSSSSSPAHRNGVENIKHKTSNTFYGDYQSSHKTIDNDSLNTKCNSGNNSPSHHGNIIGLYDGGEVEGEEDEEEGILRMSSSLASSQVIHSSDATNTAIINSANISNSSNTNVAGNVFNDKKSSNLGTMEGSWFVTPPPCFINNPNPSTHKKVSVSPLEDILIEHPSISVFHSHSTIVESSCVSILDPSFSTMDQNTGLTTGADGGSIDSSSNNVEQQQLKPSTSSSANNSPQTRSKRCGNNNNTNNRSGAQANVPNELPLSSSSSSSSQLSSATSSPLSSPSSSNPNQMSPNHHRSNSARVQRGDSRGSRSASGAATHQRQGLLNEITNVLAPMQKAYQARSQKFLKKSFMNRQNLVMYQSNQRPKRYNRKNPPPTGYSNNRKAC